MSGGDTDRKARLSTPSIRMGEMSIARDGDMLRTLLGSCIGVALFDTNVKIAGLAHIVLPESKGAADRPGKYADTAIPLLIDQLAAAAGRRLRLQAKIAGGASMFPTTVAARIGRANAEACEQILQQHSIPLLAKHCGGEVGRRMLVDASSGKVVIEIVGENSIEL